MKVICPVSGTENVDRVECKQCGTDLRPLIQVSGFPAQALREGEQCLAQGLWAKAAEKLCTAVDLDPESAEAHWRLAEALENLGLHDTAASHLELAVRISPEQTEMHAALSTLNQHREIALSASEHQRQRTRTQRLFLRLIPVVALLLGALLALAIPPFLHRERQPDWTHVVQQRLGADSLTREFNLQVMARPGVLLISGEVPSELHRDLVLQVVGHDITPRVDASQLTVAPIPPSLRYQVRLGDSWWTIARRKYGAASLWPLIVRANEGRAPARPLHPGETLSLPPLTITPR